MTTSNDQDIKQQEEELGEGEKIERGFTEMEALYRSRCVQSPAGTNVFVREIEKED
jgi:hypothetical protein